jgi:hypothetical protein
LEINFVITVILLCHRFANRSTVFWDFMEPFGFRVNPTGSDKADHRTETPK